MDHLWQLRNDTLQKTKSKIKQVTLFFNVITPKISIYG